MELYGAGEVVGAEAGKGIYTSEIHKQYYRLYAAHNTVIVNNASRGQGGWIGIGQDTVQVVAAEPMPRAEAVSPECSFATTAFTNRYGADARPAEQQRTMALIRTTPTTGYYVDALIDLSSSSSIKTRGNTTVEGTMTEHVPEVPIPDIDLTPFYNWALEHGEVRNGFTATTDITPNGGILWVEGDVHISAPAVVHGSIIATGDINVSGQIDIVPTTCAFGLVSRDGDIHVTSGGTINGLIYAKTGGLQHTANGEIVRQIIVNGDIKKAGNSDIMSGYARSVPAPPGIVASTDNIVIATWKK